jgi:ethanolamine permease
MFWNEDYRPGVYGVAAFYVIAIVYFAFAGRHKLVLSPEEEFAMTHGAHGRPDLEGYGHTRLEALQGPQDVEEQGPPPQ